MDAKTREMHRWVAQGLAYTCWVVYADQISGLGPDAVRMADGGKLWIKEVWEWESEGRPETVNNVTGAMERVPPGVREPGQRQKSQRDYAVADTAYYLRPEVCVVLACFSERCAYCSWDRQRKASI